jgi:putative transposase
MASVIGFLKGKSAWAIARQFGGKVRNLAGEHFWARGYAVLTVGLSLKLSRGISVNRNSLIKTVGSK